MGKVVPVMVLDEELILNEIINNAVTSKGDMPQLYITEYISEYLRTHSHLVYGIRKNYRSYRRRIEEFVPKTKPCS